MADGELNPFPGDCNSLHTDSLLRIVLPRWGPAQNRSRRKPYRSDSQQLEQVGGKGSYMVENQSPVPEREETQFCPLKTAH